MFKRNDEIKAGIVAYLKSKKVITDLLYNASSDEIRESQWQGTVDNYPFVRVKINSNTPQGYCGIAAYSASILCFSEEASSQEADKIAGIIGNTLDNIGFTSAGTTFTSYTTNVIPAIRQDTRTWRSEVTVDGIAS